jgi:hypothetical protein
MNHPTDTRVDVDQLMLRVREEARRRRESMPPDGRPNLYLDSPDEVARYSPRAATIPVKDEYALGEFLHYQNEDFLRNAYIGVLRRAPDPGGYEHYLESLRSGAMSKVDVLARLRHSAEGRAKGVQIVGLWRSVLYRRLRRMPVLGYGVTWANHLLRLPRLAEGEERARSSLDAVVTRLDGIEQRLALLASRVEQTHALSEQASTLSVVAAELSGAALADPVRRPPASGNGA